MKHLIITLLFTIGTFGLMAQSTQSSEASKKILVRWEFPEIDSGNAQYKRYVINLDEHPIYQYAVKINEFPHFFIHLRRACCRMQNDNPCILLCLDTSLIHGLWFIDVAQMNATANPDRYAQYVSGEKTPLDIVASKKSAEVYEWIHQELEKNRIVSIVYKNPQKNRTLITARSFDNN